MIIGHFFLGSVLDPFLPVVGQTLHQLTENPIFPAVASAEVLGCASCKAVGLGELRDVDDTRGFVAPLQASKVYKFYKHDFPSPIP